MNRISDNGNKIYITLLVCLRATNVDWARSPSRNETVWYQW